MTSESDVYYPVLLYVRDRGITQQVSAFCISSRWSRKLTRMNSLLCPKSFKSNCETDWQLICAVHPSTCRLWFVTSLLLDWTMPVLFVVRFILRIRKAAKQLNVCNDKFWSKLIMRDNILFRIQLKEVRKLVWNLTCSSLRWPDLVFTSGKRTIKYQHYAHVPHSIIVHCKFFWRET